MSRREETLLNILDTIKKYNEYKEYTPGVEVIGAELHISPSYTRNSRRLLEENGFLKRVGRYNYGDNKRIVFELTEKGQDALDNEVIIWH